MIKAKGIADNQDYIVLAKEDFERLHQKAYTNGKHGYWIHTAMIQYCSHCDHSVNNIDNQDAFRFKYCPWCGAKMDEEEQK